MATVAPTPEMIRAFPPPAGIEPDGAPPWPRILLRGPTGSRKSWAAALLSRDERLGKMVWLEIGGDNTTAREYGAIPGTRYTIVAHDGTWTSITDQLGAHWREAMAAEERGDPPVPLTVDAMQAVHEMLGAMADVRARRKLAEQLVRKGENPAAAWRSEIDVSVTPDLHQLVRNRHKYFMWFVHNWPGPVTLICAEEMSTVFENGEPTKEKAWNLKGRKDLPGQCSAEVRLIPGGTPEVLKLRSVRQGLMPDHQLAGERADFTLANLIFTWVGCQAGVSRAPKSTDLDADVDAPGEVPEDPAEEMAHKAVRAILGATNVALAQHWLKVTQGHQLRDRDVAALLGDADREVLGVREDRELPLLVLAQLSLEYCQRHGDDHQCDGRDHVGAHGVRDTGATLAPAGVPEAPEQPQATDIDWDAELAKAQAIADPAKRRTALDNAWRAARFAQASPEVIGRLADASNEATAAILAAAPPGTALPDAEAVATKPAPGCGPTG